MGIFASGYFTVSGVEAAFRFFIMAKVAVITPTLPKNIRSIRIIDDPVEREAVMPVDNPVLLIADTASNRISKVSLDLSKICIAIVETKVSVMEITISDTARTKLFSEIVLPKTLACFLPVATAQTVQTRTPKVEIFIPPAVEPEAPPMNIKIMPRRFEFLENFAMLNSAKPAVLQVTD